MKFRIRYGLCGLLLLPIILIACESVPDEMRVLEKSRQVVPQWLSQGVGLKPTPDGIDYVFCKEKVLDLTLGLTQTEFSVLYNLKFQMYQLIMSHVDSTRLSPKSAVDLRENIGKIMDKELTKDNIKDFYFDKITLPLAESGLIPEYYRIYSYAHVDAKQRASITSAVKGYIQSYPGEDLRSQLKSVSQF